MYWVVYLKYVENVISLSKLIGERSEPLSDKLGGEILYCHARTCMYLYIYEYGAYGPTTAPRVTTLYVACAARAK